MLHFNHHGATSSQIPTLTLPCLFLLITAGIFSIVWAWKDLTFLGLEDVHPAVRYVVAALGLGFLNRSLNLMRAWNQFRKSRNSYTSMRRSILESLPEQLKPADRVCLRCANIIT